MEATKVKNIIKKVFETAKEIKSDERGYGMAELMLIIALLGAIGVGVYSVLNSSLAGEDGAAEKVGGNIVDIVDNWGPEI